MMPTEVKISETGVISPPREYILKPKPFYDFVKRAFDLIVSSLVLILLSPVFLVVAVIIKLSDGGSVFYRPVRIGKNGEEFRMLKFRTMKMNADRLEDMLTPEQFAEYKVSFKIKNDPRITPIGRFLRKTSIDELPQFLNVFLGQMSFIGPRPVLEEETYLYGENRSMLLSVKPGLTGYWQAYGRDGVSYENGERQEMELEYIRKRGFIMDIKIFFMSFVSVLSVKNAS